jgi:uncharacterized membrane protein YphA (DoxX/SURF4 family)
MSLPRQRLEHIDVSIILFMRRWSVPAARLALFVIFTWFGVLKVLGLSPATPLVTALFNQTLSWLLPFQFFYIAFALYEILIGITFIIPGLERLAIALLLPHMISTSLPLFLVSSTVWQAPFVPTLEGQYIIKNLALIAAAIGIAAHISPLQKDARSA